MKPVIRVSLIGLVCLFACIFTVASQTPSVTITKLTASPINGAVCSGTRIIYAASVSKEFNSGSLNYTWTVEHDNSSSSGDNTGSSFEVVWGDNPADLAKVDVVVRDNAGHSASNSYSSAIISVNGLDFDPVAPINVPYCTSYPYVYTLMVSPMIVPHTGGAVNEAPRTEVVYIFTLPTGWKQYQTGLSGSIGSTINSITIYASDDCAATGDVMVQGTINNTGCYGYGSHILHVPLKRTISVVPPSGFVSTRCGDRTPITFTADASCGSNYTWHVTNQWTILSQSANTMTAKPTGWGSSQISVDVQFGAACNTVTSSPYIVPYDPNPPATPIFNPAGPLTVCNQASTTVTVNSLGYGISYKWYSNDAVLINGETHRLSNPLVTTTNSVTLQPTSINYEVANIYVASAFGDCTNGLYNNLRLNIGTPFLNQGSLDGTTVTAMDGSVAQPYSAPGRHTLVVYPLGNTTNPVFTVSDPSNTITYTPSGNQLGFFAKQSVTFHVSMRVSNACGSYSGIIYFCNSNCINPARVGSSHDDKLITDAEQTLNNELILFPNPAGNQIQVEFQEIRNPETIIEIFNLQGKKVYSGTYATEEAIEVQTANLPNGEYVLNLATGGKQTRRIFQIKH
jgi:hypothetical protein